MVVGECNLEHLIPSIPKIFSDWDPLQVTPCQALTCSAIYLSHPAQHLPGSGAQNGDFAPKHPTRKSCILPHPRGGEPPAARAFPFRLCVLFRGSSSSFSSRSLPLRIIIMILF